MKRFACGDVVTECAASWVANSDEELLELVESRAAEVHGVTDPPPELLSAVRLRISAVA